ncbi:hypothetical protein FHS61_000322 [Altererythrobacter atlanticus]|uniref:Uncharacterized protein n=1 Tax=Croceibacterium atlanticum TaxID=1267766 RepID=A0A0F7KTI0_9SPHN|nr:hypothetical protein [Croceibacterium atlanticum]AKH42552.1 hypothetical protein WYH_01513 [Croceibacterium atlanticum]MBB5731329.1 hypothetical protein [Croceibacterium atlanticum]
MERRSPGIYLLTLEDGARWEFVEAVPFSYNPPGRGSTVEISRAALGSFMLRYAGQPGVRVKRIQ